MEELQKITVLLAEHEERLGKHYRLLQSLLEDYSKRISKIAGDTPANISDTIKRLAHPQ